MEKIIWIKKITQYKKLQSLFKKIYIYLGGIFEWILFTGNIWRYLISYTR